MAEKIINEGLEPVMETNPNESNNPTVTPEPKLTTPPEPAEMDGGEEELERIRTALKKANAEAAKFRKQAEAYEADQRAKEEAEMSELQRANKRIADLEAEVKTRDLEERKRAVAAKVGLPPALALRLRGETDEELEDDAKSLLESLPQPQTEGTKPSQLLTPANPKEPRAVETPEQRRERLFGAKEDIFDPDFMRAHGGGVVVPKE